MIHRTKVIILILFIILVSLMEIGIVGDSINFICLYITNNKNLRSLYLGIVFISVAVLLPITLFYFLEGLFKNHSIQN